MAPDLTLSVEERGSGAPLVLLHGFTGSARSWDAVADAWAERFRVLAVELIGHGRSDAPANARRYGMERAAGDLAALLDALGIAGTHLVGYSLGGRVSLRFAIQHPDRVASLVLESASAGIDDDAERAARRARDEVLADRLERDGIERFVDLWEREPLFATQRALPASVRAALRATRLAQRPHGLANSLRGMGAGTAEPLWDRLARVRAPVLVVTGALDVRYCEIAARLAAALPRGRHAVVAGAGHAPHLEHPTILARLVLEFLTSEDAAGEGEHMRVEVSR